jgi:hypothetical protein
MRMSPERAPALFLSFANHPRANFVRHKQVRLPKRDSRKGGNWQCLEGRGWQD